LKSYLIVQSNYQILCVMLSVILFPFRKLFVAELGERLETNNQN